MGVKVTNAEWHRRRDRQRLLNYHKAMRAAEVDAAPIPPAVQIIGIDEAVDLTPQFINEFARVMENNFNLDFAGMMAGDAVRLGVDPAGEPEGRRVTAREIRDRPIRRRGRDNTAPPLGVYAGQTYFNRWLDMKDSEDELQSFLWACHKAGETGRREGAMSVKELEGDADG